MSQPGSERSKVPDALFHDAAMFLRGYLSDAVKQEIREAIQNDPEEWWAPYHFGWGMGLRNALRHHGWTEQLFGITNLDNLYVELVEAAVGVEAA